MILIGNKAPDFTTAAVMQDGQIKNEFTLSKEINGKYGILFFYPLDFTFVCPSELIAVDNRIDEFKARNTLIMSISIDSQYTHSACAIRRLQTAGSVKSATHCLQT